MVDLEFTPTIPLPLSTPIFITYIHSNTLSELPKVCRNYTLTLVSRSHYTAGGKYCRRWEYYFVTNELLGKCCGMRLRGSPAGRVYKEKVRAKKKQIAAVYVSMRESLAS